MRQRYTINDEGMLVDRHGYVLGRIVGLTLEVGEGGAFKGGVGEPAVNGQEQHPPAPLSDDEQATLIDVPVERRLGEDGKPVALLSPAGEVEAVWEHYVAVMGPRRKELDPASRSLIREALKVASRVECLQAIDGCRASAFHMGFNDRGKKYNRLSQILKGKRGIRTTREQIDLFLDIAEKHGSGPSDTSVDPAMLSRAKRNVLDAWEFPKSEQAKKAGEMSAAWLAQHGYRVEPDPETRRPRFIREGE